MVKKLNLFTEQTFLHLLAKVQSITVGVNHGLKNPGALHLFSLRIPFDLDSYKFLRMSESFLFMSYIIHQYLPYSCRDGDMGLIPGSGRSSGEGNGYHYSIPAWRILWTEEPGRLYSAQSHRVQQEWANEHACTN